MIKFFCFVALAILIVTTSASGQKMYEPGYIVQGTDTTKGFIERTDEIQLGQKIHFKNQLEGSSTAYSPGEITGFGFINDRLRFESVTTQIKKFNDARTIVRFAKVLLRGYTNLYKLQLDESERSIIFEQDNTYVYIVKKEEKFVTLGIYEYRLNSSVGLSKDYIDVFKYRLFTDCPAALENIESTEFNDKFMIRVVNRYNKCKSPETITTVEEYEVKPVIKHGVEVGCSLWRASGDVVSDGKSFSAGYFWDILKPDISRSTSLRVGVSYMRLSYKHEDLEERFDVHYLKVPLYAQANLTKNSNAKFIPFINGGLTLSLATNTSIDFIDTLPLVHVGAGTYVRRVRLEISIDKEGLSSTASTFYNLSLGLRLDK